MTESELKRKYNTADFWRINWMRLANKSEQNRLQSKQERIERRAVRANNRIGRILNSLNGQN